MTKTNLKDYPQHELIEYVKSLGLPAYRGRQIFAWLYKPQIKSYDQMTDLPNDLREKLDEFTEFSSFSPCDILVSEDGTKKLVFKLADNTYIESVLIPEDDRYTLCVSSQVGCAMGCRFCKTATMGFTRNLATSEIMNQVLAAQDNIKDNDNEKAISNLVFMGMGEPLANFNNVVNAIQILADQRGLNFSERRITVSTCGLVPKIKELGLKTKANLAISLHAVDDHTRNELMPINQTYPLDSVLEACRQFPLPKRKRIMIEYILIKDMNDSEEHARLLAQKLTNIPCKINLLPCNPIDEISFEKPTAVKIEKFQKILWKAGYTVIVRNSKGADIAAACGQLAVKKQQEG